MANGVNYRDGRPVTKSRMKWGHEWQGIDRVCRRLAGS